MMFENSIRIHDASQKSKNLRRSLFLISQLAVVQAINHPSYSQSRSQKESHTSTNPEKPFTNGATISSKKPLGFPNISNNPLMSQYPSPSNVSYSEHRGNVLVNGYPVEVAPSGAFYHDDGYGFDLFESDIPSYLEFGDYPLSGYFNTPSWGISGNQAVLFPDGQLRFLAPAFDDINDGSYYQEIDVPVYVEQIEVDSIDNREAEEIAVVNNENDYINSVQLNEVSSKLEQSEEFQLLDAKLDQLTLALSQVISGSTKGESNTPATNPNVHINGLVEGMDVLNHKVEELVKAVGIVTEQNQLIGTQTSKVLKTSTKTLSEVDTINEKLTTIKKDLTLISEKESHIEQQQTNNIVRSSKDINEINERITDLLRTVGGLSKGSYNHQHDSKVAHDSNASQELKEIRGNLNRMQNSITAISSEVTSFLSKVEKTSLQDIEGINQLRKEFSQFKVFMDKRIAESNNLEKENHAETVQMLNKEYTLIGDLSKRVDGLFASLKIVLEQLQKLENKDADYTKAITTIEGLLQRLSQTSDTLDRLIKKEMNLISNRDYSKPTSGIDSRRVLSSLEELRNEMKNLTAQQIDLFQKYNSSTNNEGYEKIVNHLNQLQKTVIQLVSEGGKYFKVPDSGNYPKELIRDIENMSENIINLNSIVKGLVKQQQKLIESYGENNKGGWKEFNVNFEKLGRVINMLSTQNSWIKQQTDVISKMDSHITEIGSKINHLIEEQSRLEVYPHKGSKSDPNIAYKLDQLRKTVEQLAHDQQILLGKYREGKASDVLTKDIQSVNYKLADLSSVVTRLLQEQKSIVNKLGSQKNRPSDGKDESKEIHLLSEQIERLREVVTLIAKQQKTLLQGKSITVNTDNITVLDSRLNSLGQKMDYLIKQQQLISGKYGNSEDTKNQNSEYRNVETILNQLRQTVTEVIKEQTVLIRGSGGKLPSKLPDDLERVIENLAKQCSRIYNVVDKIGYEQEQILKNDKGEVKDIQEIKDKLTKLSDVLIFITKQQNRILGGDFHLKIKDYSGDVEKLGEQLARLKSTMNVLVQQQKSLLSDRDDNKVNEQLKQLYTVVDRLVQDQEKLITIKINGKGNSGLDQNIVNMNERLAKLSVVIDRLVNQQNEILKYLGSESKEGNVNTKLELITSKLGQLGEVVTLLNKQQNVLLNIPRYFSLIESQSKEIGRLGQQVSQIQESINELVALEKSQGYRDDQGKGGNFAKVHIKQLTDLFRSVQRLANGQDQLFSYVKSNISEKRLNDIENVTQKLYLLNQAIQHVVNEERTLLNSIHSQGKNIEKSIQQIDMKIDKLSIVVETMNKRQENLFATVNALWKSQDSNFKLVNQKLAVLGSDVTRLISQQQKLFNSKGYSNDISVNGRLSELEKSITQLIQEQRRLILVKSSLDISPDLKREISAIDNRLNQLSQFIRELVSKQDRFLQYAEKGEIGTSGDKGDVKNYNDQFKQLFIMVSKLTQNQISLITREDVAKLFDRQNKGIQNLSLDIGQLSNRIDKVLKQQEVLNGKNYLKNGNTHDTRLFKMLVDISKNARQLLEQQNMLARNVRDNSLPKDVAKEVSSLRKELTNLTRVINEIYSNQEKIIQLKSSSTKDYSEQIYSQVEKITTELGGVSQGIGRISTVQLEILKRLGVLSDQQLQNFRNVDSKVSTLGKRVDQLVTGQKVLIGKEDNNTDKLDKVVKELGDLRDVVYKLVSQQTTILEAKWGGSYKQKVPFDVSVINTKIAKVSDTVDQLLVQQRRIMDRKVDGGLTKEVNESLETLTVSIKQIGGYVKNLYTEQTQILQNHTELLKQNLNKTDKVDHQLIGLSQKVDEIIRIQAILLRRVQKTDKGTETRTDDDAIIQKLSSLQGLVNQIVLQQEKLFKAKLNGRVPKEVLEELRKLDSRFGELIGSVNSFSNKQRIVISKDSDSKLSESLVTDINNLSEKLDSISSFVKETMNIQSRVFNNNEVIQLLKNQSGQINKLDAKLNELNSRFSSLVEQQAIIIKRIDYSKGSKGSNDNMTPIYEDLQGLRSVVKQIVEYQKSLGSPNVNSRLPKEALILMEKLNERFLALDSQIVGFSEGQSNLLKLEKQDERHLGSIEGYISGIVKEFRPLKEAVNQILSEQSTLLRRNDVIKILQQQAGHIDQINNRLGSLGAQMNQLVNIQKELLRGNGSKQQTNNAGIDSLINRFSELSETVNNIVDRQNELTKPQIMNQIPQSVVEEIKTVTQQMSTLNEQVTTLSEQQQAIIQSLAGKKGSPSELVVKTYNRDLQILSEQIFKLGKMINGISSRQDKVANNDRVLDVIKKQGAQIQSLGIGMNNLRKELGVLINRQQGLLQRTYGNTQQNRQGTQAILEQLQKLDSRVDGLFEQQKVLVNKEIYAAIPKEITSQIDQISSQLGELRQVVTEVSREQTTFIEHGNKNKDDGNASNIDGILKLNQRFNQLTKLVIRIAEGQNRITSNEKVVKILEQHSRAIQRIDNRLTEVGSMVQRILENQFKLIQSPDYQNHANNKGVNLQPIVLNLQDLREEVRYLIEQQRKLNRPSVGNSLPQALVGKVNEINLNLNGLNRHIQSLFEEQSELIKASNNRQGANYKDSIDKINRSLNEFGRVIRALVGQQTQILKNEEVLKVIASELGDLKEVKSTVRNFGHQIRNLVEQQRIILNNISQLGKYKSADSSRDLLGKLALLSRTVNELVEKQTILLRREVVGTVPKEIMEEITILNKKFNFVTSSLESIAELQKRLLDRRNDGSDNHEEASPEVIGYLNDLRQKFGKLYQEVTSISSYQQELMSRKELLSILKRHSVDINIVGRKVEAVDEKIQVLINQQRELYNLIEKKGTRDQVGGKNYSIVIERLQQLEKSIVLLSGEQRRLQGIERNGTKQVLETVNSSTQYLDGKMGRLSTLIDRVRNEQQEILQAVKNNNIISKEVLSRVDKVNDEIKNLEDVVKQLAQEQHEVNVKVTKLLGLPQDMQEVKQRLVTLNNLTNKLINQQVQLYEVTVQGSKGNGGSGPKGYDNDLRNRLSELFQLMQQLTVQQNGLMKVENRNSQSHTQEISSLASKVYKVEQTVTHLLEEQQSLLKKDNMNNLGGFNNLDKKVNLLNEAVKQLVNQQQKIMKLAGLGRLVQQQSQDIRGVKNNLTNLTDVVNQLVNQQKDLLIRTKYEKEYVTNNELNTKFVEKNIKDRERNGYKKGSEPGETVSYNLENRVEQVTDLMKQLVLQQKETILRISRKESINYDDIVGKMNTKILQLNELAKQLFAEQTSLIQRGFDSLSKQQYTGFQKIDGRLNDIGSALKNLSNYDNGALDRRIQALSQQQSRDTSKLNSRLNQISKMLERIATRPNTGDNTGLNEIRNKLNGLESAMTRILGKLDRGGNANLSQEQFEELRRVSRQLPNLNQSVEKLALVEEVGNPIYIQELTNMDQSLSEYGRAIIDIDGSIGGTYSNPVGYDSQDMGLDIIDIDTGDLYSGDRFAWDGANVDGYRFVDKGFGPLRPGPIISRRRIEFRSNRNRRGSKLGSKNKTYRKTTRPLERLGKRPLVISKRPKVLEGSITSFSPASVKRSNTRYQGYEYRQGFWYPKNEQFEKIMQVK
ncbi:hypothetical protein K7432_000011 [Basidiobolus ranarum]|uniref:Uncharacterized protein n=1 Tax=Basidiobolus ranarum TaxID=34480 RepID=A0ABR2WBW4_9FUNG